MTWHGDIGIISGRYHSTEVVEDGQTTPRTVIELFGRSKTGQSICLLIEGLSPTFEVASLGAWDEGEDLPEYLVNRLRSLDAHEDIVSHKGPSNEINRLGYEANLANRSQTTIPRSPITQKVTTARLEYFFWRYTL